MKSKSQKKAELQRIKEKLPSSSITVFTTFAPAPPTGGKGTKGLSVAQMRELKRNLKELESEYVVTKKTLVDRALKDLAYDGVDVFGLAGSLGIVFSTQDAYAVTKKLYEFAKKNEALKFFGAFLDGKFIDEQAVLEMAKMPSRNELLARFAGMLRYPISALAIVLNQISDRKQATSVQV